MRGNEEHQPYARVFPIDHSACQALYKVVCSMILSEEYSDNTGEGVIEALLINLIHFWMFGQDDELYRAVECLKVEDEQSALTLQRLSKLDPADYPELFGSIEDMRQEFGANSNFYVDDVDLNDHQCLVKLSLMFYSPSGRLHPKMDHHRDSREDRNHGRR